MFVLDDNTSVTISFSSLEIQQLPDLKFFGPKKMTMHYEEVVSKNYENWNNNNSNYIEELFKLLGV